MWLDPLPIPVIAAPPMLRYRAVLFDLDGTLIDSTGLIVESFHHMTEQFGIARQPDACWLAGVGTPLRSLLEPWARDEAMLEDMLAAYRAHNLAHHDARVRAYPGIVEAVDALLAAGVRVAVVTSKNRSGTERGLAVAGLAGKIDVRVCVEDVTRHKPDREPVDVAVARLGADPASTLFVGDSVHDMMAGRAAGVATGAASWGPFQRSDLQPADPTWWLDSPACLVPVVLGPAAPG
jgi:pyrophosphatase PpaX